MGGRRRFAFLLSCGVFGLSASGVLGGRPTKTTPTRSASLAIAQGLKIWRKPGAIQGGAACATCHSPDGIELAEYAFDDADLKRRAQPHLSANDTQELVDYIHALRYRLHLTHLRNPNVDRPLQPGGSVLPGVDPATRDLAFGLELKAKLPRLFDARIETIEEAKDAERQLYMVPATTLKIGIPLNPLSEDVVHGREHSSIAQWLPEKAPLIASSELSAWYSAEDRYLSDPSQEHLHDLLLMHTRLVDTRRMLGFSEISELKFRALLVLQDRMRHRVEQAPRDVTAEVLAYGNYNPIWEVGEAARELMDRDPRAIGMDPEIQSKKLAGPTLSEQLHSLRISWFWTGWLSDQGLFRTSHDDRVRLGMWFSESLSKDGPYPFHDVYANARRQAVITFNPASWGEPLGRKRRIWDLAGLRSFGRYLTDMPKEPKYRQLYVAFTANCFRMNLLLLEDQIEKTHEVWLKPNTKSYIAEMVNFIVNQDPDDRERAEKLKSELFSLTDNAKERF